MYMNPSALELVGGQKYAMTVTANRISIFPFLVPPRSFPLVSFIMSGRRRGRDIREKQEASVRRDKVADEQKTG